MVFGFCLTYSSKDDAEEDFYTHTAKVVAVIIGTASVF